MAGWYSVKKTFERSTSSRLFLAPWEQANACCLARRTARAHPFSVSCRRGALVSDMVAAMVAAPAMLTSATLLFVMLSSATLLLRVVVAARCRWMDPWNQRKGAEAKQQAWWTSVA